MNGTPIIPQIPKPSLVALTWLQGQGFYILAIDGVARSYTDPDEAVAAIRVAVDLRLDGPPLGNC